MRAQDRPYRRRPRGGWRAAWALTVALAPAATAQGWWLAGLDDVPEPAPSYVASLHVAANAARAAADRPALAWDDGLARAARQYAAELARRGVLDHTGATPESRTLADRLVRAGSPYTSVGENLAFERDAPDPVATVVQGWLASPPHRRNLLLPEFDRVGYGSAVDTTGGRYVVQVLAAVPWAPTLTQATLTAVQVRSVVLEVAVAAATADLGLLELDGVTERVALAPGEVTLRRDVPGTGALRVRLAVDQGGSRFLLDEDGELDRDGRWSPAAAPRRWLRVTSATLQERLDTHAHVRIDVTPARDVAVLVDGVHVPDATIAPGRLELTLPLADGDAVPVALAEPRGAGQLLVRHAFVLVRTGDTVRWAVRP